MANLIEGFSGQVNTNLQNEEGGQNKEQRPAHADEILDEKRTPEPSKDLTINRKNDLKNDGRF